MRIEFDRYPILWLRMRHTLSRFTVIFESDRKMDLSKSLVSVGSYCVVFDTVIEDLDCVEFVDRPWGKGNNPKTAVDEFLKTNSDFVVDY